MDKAAVVLVDCGGGSELDAVRTTLAALDTPTVLIKHTDLACLPISFNPATGVWNVDGRSVKPAVVWVRHWSAGAQFMRPLDAATWAGLLEQLAASTTAALPGSRPVGPVQLADAGRLGVKTPRTEITTDVLGAVREIGTQKVIVKTPDFRLFVPDRQSWPACLPAIIDRDTPLGDRAVTGRPVVVQEYVAHVRELRVYYLNGGMCAFEVRKPGPASIWTDPGSVTVTPVECPQIATEAVQTLCAAWELRYGAFDLLITDMGELVFLEANADGDWLWYEHKAAWHGVSFMAAVMVRDLYMRSARR